MLQLPMPHTPPLQPGDALAGAAHTLPQAPQFWIDSRSASQPLPTILSQSPKPGSHEARAQAPATQAGVAWAGAPQSLPQPPQFLASVRVSISQPSLGLALQCA